MTPLVIRLGEQNLSSGRCKFQLWYCPSTDSALTPEEAHLFAALKVKDASLVSQGFSLPRSVLMGKNKDIVGALRDVDVQAADGLIFKIFAESRANRKPLKTGGVFLKVRSTAALRKVSLPLYANSANVVSDFSVFGKFDILTMKEAKMLGVKISKRFADVYDEENAKSVLTFEELAPAVESRTEIEFKEVTDSEGEAMPTLARRRAFRKK